MIKILLNGLYYSIKENYDKVYAWEYFEKDSEKWYMDHSNYGDDNYFQLLFDVSIPPYVEGIQKNVMLTSFNLTSSPLEVLVSYPHLKLSSYGDDILNIHDSIYVDPHDQVGHLEHRT